MRNPNCTLGKSCLSVLCLLAWLFTPLQDVRWAKKRKGEAVEQKSLECTVVSLRAFPGLSWEQIVVKAGTSSEFEQQVKTAKRLWQTMAAEIEADERGFTREDFDDQDAVTMTMERSYTFITDGDFEKYFKVKPSTIGLKSETLTLETGAEASGVVLAEDTPFRKLTVSHSQRTALTRSLHNSAHQLRPEQGTDFMRLWRVRTWPTSFTKAATTVTEVMAKAEEALKKQSEVPPAHPPPAPLAALDSVSGVNDDEEPEEEEDEVAASVAAAEGMLQMRPSEGKSGKGKGKSKVRKEKNDKQKPRQSGGGFSKRASVAASTQASCSTHIAGSVDTAQSGSTHRSRSPARSGSKTPQERLLAQCVKYTLSGLLRLSRVVGGDNAGQDVNQAKRIADAMEKLPRMEAEALSLRTHLDLVSLARLASVDGMAASPRKSAMRFCDKIYKKMDAVPPVWACTILQCHLRDWLDVLKFEDVEAYVAAMLPSAAEGLCYQLQTQQKPYHSRLRCPCS